MFCVFTSISITLIRLGHNIIGISPIIVLIDGANAHQFISDSKSESYRETVVHDPINPVINLILLVAGVITLIGIVKYKWFIKLLVTSHYGIYESIQDSRKYGNSDCYLYLSFTHQTKRWFKRFLREIVIEIPITCLDPAVSFGNVKVIGSEKLWFIRMEKMLCISH